MAKVTTKLQDVASIADRVKAFDAATNRQRGRQRTRTRAGAMTRGWRREDFYGHAKPR